MMLHTTQELEPPAKPERFTNARGRNPLAWFGIGFVGGVFALIAVLVMEPLNEGDEHR